MKKGMRNQNVYRVLLEADSIESEGGAKKEVSGGPTFYNFARFKNIENTKYYLFKHNVKSTNLIQSNDILKVEEFKERFSWINIFDPSEKDLNMLRSVYNVHDITLADIREKGRDEKIELFRHYTFITLRLFSNADLKDSQEIDFSIIVFRDFIITTHDKMWGGIKDTLNFLYLICQHTKFSPVWVFYSIIIEFLQDVRDIVDRIGPDVGKDVMKEENLEHLLRQNFMTVNALFSIKSFLKPKKSVIKQMMNNGRFKGKIKKMFGLTLKDFTAAEKQTIEYIKTVERSQDLILALVDMNQTKESNEINRIINKFSLVTFVFLPCQTIAGFWGMNVKVPFHSDGSVFPFVMLCMAGPFISLFIILIAGLIKNKRSLSGRKKFGCAE